MASVTDSQPAIRLLSPDTVAQIAAGEVIERPVNVVRELVENSIDAGAHTITVSLRGGGLSQIRVEDDGEGIPSACMALALQRHATSKLVDAGQLHRIGTLGFRGEALFSISAVSHLTLASRVRAEKAGRELRAECGQIVSQSPVGRSPGTIVSVENLFVNTPVRLRHLRSAAAEAGRVGRLMQRYAMAHAHIGFVYAHDDRELLRTHGRGQVREVLYDIHGGPLARSMLEVSARHEDMVITGYVSPPATHFPNRSRIDIFVNGRWIQDRALTQAVSQAYHGRLPTGRFPGALLSLQLDPAQLDVNVHPQKLEVRFLQARRIFGTLLRTVEQVLQAEQQVPDAGMLGQQVTAPSPAPAAGQAPQAGLPLSLPRVGLNQGAQSRLPLSKTRTEAMPEVADLPPLNIIGQVGQMYIVAETDRGMVLVDQHAAHERVLFEKWMHDARQAQEGAPRQNLLVPQTLSTGTEEAGILAQHLGLLRHLGFEVEEFGSDTFVVRSIPALLASRAPETVLQEMLQALTRNRNLIAEELESQLVRMICKRASIKAGQVLSLDEMEVLLRQLGDCKVPLTCPHGRPTLIQFSAQALEKAFGRV